MEFWDIKNPNVSITLLPLYVPVNQTRTEIGLELNRRLKDEPDNTLCLVAMDNDYCLGFIIAYAREKDVFLWQSRSSPKASKCSKVAFNYLREWTKAKGLNEIRIKTDKRTAKLMKRKYGFKPSKRGEMVLCLESCIKNTAIILRETTTMSLKE